MQFALSGRKEAQLAVARFLAVCATRNDTAYRVDATDTTLASESCAPKASANAQGVGTLNRYRRSAASLPKIDAGWQD
jgi:hypothetical protein